MLKVLFFGQLKDVIKTEYLEIDIIRDGQSGKPINTVAMLRNLLQEKGDIWNEYLAYGKALVAVNQEMTGDDTVLNDTDEIAFFPPVTGG
ncbi:MAG: molybdopterin synthase sulfur carrier subunit [Paraglaciecola sp.]|jgi:molybdopterin synthase sulfur carrier subunit